MRAVTKAPKSKLSITHSLKMELKMGLNQITINTTSKSMGMLNNLFVELAVHLSVI